MPNFKLNFFRIVVFQLFLINSVLGQLNFHLPVVIQNKTFEPINFHSAREINNSEMKLYGKFKFSDTICLNESNWYDSTKPQNYPYGYLLKDAKDTFNSDGFQLFPDYNTTVYYKSKADVFKNKTAFFPVYVVNETAKTKLFFIEDSRVSGIQELKDTVYPENWYPIEHKAFSFGCEFYSGIKVHPAEFLVILVPKYWGDSQLKMRVKVKIGENIYHSMPYLGHCNYRQLRMEKKSWIHNVYLSDKASTIFYYFYGSWPKGYIPF
jgi:hypothetical protein